VRLRNVDVLEEDGIWDVLLRRRVRGCRLLLGSRCPWWWSRRPTRPLLTASSSCFGSWLVWMPHGGDGGGDDGDVALPTRLFHFQSVDASPVIRTSLRCHTEDGWNIL
jgi:hypothetical protein